MPKVHNLKAKTASEDAVYIGRGTPWGNPYVLNVHGDRDEVIRKYAKYLESKPQLQQQMKEQLAGKDLVCHCAPLACHGDIILRVANNMLPAPERPLANKLGRLMQPGDWASLDWDNNGKWQDVHVTHRATGERSQSGIMLTVSPAPRNSSGVIDADWLHPSRTRTQWYTHPESSCVFMDLPGMDHDMLTLFCDAEEAMSAVMSGYSISPINLAQLYISLTRGE